MDSTRRQRYVDKMALIERRCTQVREWTLGASVESFRGDEHNQLAVYKALQEIIEAAMDLCAMRVSDVGLAAKDDYANIKNLEDRRDLSGETAVVLRAANGFRNRLVHEYDTVREDLVLDFIAHKLPLLARFLDQVRLWLKT